MADVVNVVPKGYTENPDLMPIPRSQQKYGAWTWMLMMFSMNTCIPMFFLGPIGQGLGLNFWQALWGSLVGNLAAVIVMWLNGVVGVRHGIGLPRAAPRLLRVPGRPRPGDPEGPGGADVVRHRGVGRLAGHHDDHREADRRSEATRSRPWRSGTSSSRWSSTSARSSS